MSLRINTNVMAINAHRNLLQTNLQLQRSIERLSSGLRINRASDDPAGFVTSENQRTVIASVQRAIDNVTDSISLIQTAEAVFDEIENLLRTMKTLALHAANTGPNDTAALEADQAQIKDAIAALDQIATTRKFGAKVLLDGSNGKSGVSSNANIEFIRAGFRTANTSDLPAGACIRFSVEGQNGGLTTVTRMRINWSTLVVPCSGALGTARVTLGFAYFTFNGTSWVTTTALFGFSAGASSATLVISAANLATLINGLGGGVSASDAISYVSLRYQTGPGPNVGQEFFADINVVNATTGEITPSAINDARQRAVVRFTRVGTSPRATRTYLIAAGEFRNTGAGGTVLGLDANEEVIVNGVRVTLTAGMTIGQAVTKFNNIRNLTAVSVGTTGAGGLLFRAAGYGSDFTITLQTNRDNASGRTSGLGGSNTSADGTNVRGRLFLIGNGGTAREFEVTGNGQYITAGRTAELVGNTIRELFGLVLRASIRQNTTLTNARITVQESQLRFQIGDAATDFVERGMNSMRPSRLGTIVRISEVDVRSVVGAQRAIAALDAALEQVLSERGALGAFQRQFLEPTKSNLLVYKENIQNAESNIRDADMAAEMILFTRSQILMQSGTAMLAQANLTPQSVLQLLR